MTTPLSARDLASAVRHGTVRAVDVLAERRTAAESHSGQGIFTATDWDAAARAAAEIDRRQAAGEPLGPLAGVPVTVKDVVAVAGWPLTAGSRAFAANRATTTAPAVAQVIAADAVLLGKTNCPEFALNMITENDLFGRTANPVFPDRSPGGSSGGEAAAVAAGISTLGIGTDFGGSVRWPAACTGLVALRPTQGRVDGSGQVPGLAGSMAAAGPDDFAWANPTTLQGQSQVIGPIARSVADLGLALEVLQQPGIRAVPSAGPLRIGYSDGRHIGPVRAEIADAIRAAADDLAGHEISNAGEVFAGCLETYNRLRALDPMHDHVRAIRGNEALTGRSARDTFTATFAGSPDELADAWRAALAARAAARADLTRYDVVILPVAGGPACTPDGYIDVDGVPIGGWDVMVHLRAVTLTGAPAVSVPIGRTHEGLPISVQVVAAPGRDEDALRIAADLEAGRAI